MGTDDTTAGKQAVGEGASGGRKCLLVANVVALVIRFRNLHNVADWRGNCGTKRVKACAEGTAGVSRHNAMARARVAGEAAAALGIIGWVGEECFLSCFLSCSNGLAVLTRSRVPNWSCALSLPHSKAGIVNYRASRATPRYETGSLQRHMRAHSAARML